MKLFSCIIFCVLIFRPAVIVNSQTPVNAEKVKLLHQKEVENRYLKMKIQANEQEINELLGQLVETKTTVKRQPIYKRIFTHYKKRRLPEIVTDPVPVNNVDTGFIKINKVDTIAPIVPVVPRKENFFRRIFKIFKHKK